MSSRRLLHPEHRTLFGSPGEMGGVWSTLAFPADAFAGAKRSPSPRQCQILTLTAEGRTDNEISTALGISVKTVRTQLDRLFSRYSVRNRTALAVAWSLSNLAPHAYGAETIELVPVEQDGN